MSSTELNLRAPTTSSIPCKICEGPSELYGVTDLNKPCDLGLKHQLCGVPLYYRRCEACGFLFTDAFDDWGMNEFKTHIYNDEYIKYDPEYESKRPSGNAGVVAQLWSAHKTDMRVLDYGGGNDVLCAALRADGFKEAITYDPMVPEYALPPTGKFDLITCFETLEHLPDPVSGIGKMVEFAAEQGAILYSTLLQPDDFHQRGMSWWYVGPRNGHISIFTRQALAAAWGKHGFKTASFNEGIHLAFRSLPESWKMAVQ